MRFLYNLFKLSFQFSVATTAAIAVMYGVYSEGSHSKLGCGTDCPYPGFSCFHSVPEFTLRDVTWPRSPVPSKCFPMYLSPINRISVFFDEEESLNNQKNISVTLTFVT
jgi:hypothetical protein